MDIPKLKKNTKDFLLSEEGKISKQAIVAIGGALGTVALGAVAAKRAKAAEVEDCQFPQHSDGKGWGTHKQCYSHRNEMETTGSLNAAHKHHYNHGSHASHSSHGSHSSGCCFVKGTMVTLSDGTTKKIEEIEINDKILSYNLEKNIIEESIALEITKITRSDIAYINAGLLGLTLDHPILAQKNENEEEKIWAAIDEEMSLKNYGLENTQKLAVGDKIFHKDIGWIRVNSIEYKLNSEEVYHITKVEPNNNFIVNGFIAHNGTGSCGGWC